MKMRLTVVYEYDTGDNVETQNNYGTTDPVECAKIDAHNLESLGIETFIGLCDLTDPRATIEPVPDGS